ncbi:branched-chain amino acid ABC transporter permease, partial [Methylobacterium radiotolerans]
MVFAVVVIGGMGSIAGFAGVLAGADLLGQSQHGRRHHHVVFAVVVIGGMGSI